MPIDHDHLLSPWHIRKSSVSLRGPAGSVLWGLEKRGRYWPTDTTRSSQTTQSRVPSCANGLESSFLTPADGAATTGVSPATTFLPAVRLRRQRKEPRRSVVKACGWKRPRAPAIWMLLNEEKATPAALTFLRETQVGRCITLSALEGDRGGGKGEGWSIECPGGEGEEEGQAPFRRGRGGRRGGRTRVSRSSFSSLPLSLSIVFLFPFVFSFGSTLL